MNLSDPNIVIITIGLVAIIIEIIIGASTGFELFVLGLILVVAGLIGQFTSLTIAIISMVVLIALYIFIGRRMIKKSLHFTARKTNVESIMGRRAIVISTITPDAPGRVKIEGEEWRAQAEKTIEEGEKCTIISVSGVTVHVE